MSTKGFGTHRAIFEGVMVGVIEGDSVIEGGTLEDTDELTEPVRGLVGEFDGVGGFEGVVDFVLVPEVVPEATSVQ